MSNSLPVEHYAPTQDHELLQYPFKRPLGSFYTDGKDVYEMPENFEAFQEASNNFLAAAGVPLMDERIPVISYGSNSNPSRLRNKMGAYGDESLSAELQAVPNMLATIPDTVVAWHGKPGRSGSIFAELYKGDDTVRGSAVAHISFLSLNQLALMHASEGVTYHFVKVNALVGVENTPLEAYAYVAGKSDVLVHDGQVARVKRVEETTGHHENALTAEEAVDYMLASTEGAVDSRTAVELIDEMKDLSLPEKQARQAAIRNALRVAGLNKEFSYPTDKGFFLRGDFNFDGSSNIQMLEQAVERLRPVDPKLRNTKSDIAVNLRKRAHDELFA